MLHLLISSASLASLTGISASIHSFIVSHDYLAIIILMALESASLPIPSEVVLPLTGYFVYTGLLNLYLAIISTLIGTAIGITLDYYIAYFLGKDVVYKHAERFHINRKMLDSFDRWFVANAGFTVFIGRLIPVVRGLISFPAGFAQMDIKKFYLYSLSGSFIWNVVLIEFGYYAFGSTTNILIMLAATGIFAQALYIVYVVAMRKIRSSSAKK